ncbi:MAG: hypothetical protein MZV70_60430 [Desulfobacterales bacterium]|nr:hypothetical protein [Desulfobacterales bacterium]
MAGMPGNDLTWAVMCLTLSSFTVSPFTRNARQIERRLSIEDPRSKLQGIFDRKECGLLMIRPHSGEECARFRSQHESVANISAHRRKT